MTKRAFEDIAGGSQDCLLSATGLAAGVGGRALFHDLDLLVGAADLVEIRGPNGSGKSTLLRCLAGFREAQAGRLGRPAALEYIGHLPGVSDPMTPLENLHWLARLRGRRLTAAKLDEAMARLGLGGVGHCPCGMLSAGQQRRAALARLLVTGAELWLLDEPLAALDAAGVALVRELIAEHRAAGGAAICATHWPLTAADSRDLPATRIVMLGP